MINEIMKIVAAEVKDPKALARIRNAIEREVASATFANNIKVQDPNVKNTWSKQDDSFLKNPG